MIKKTILLILILLISTAGIFTAEDVAEGGEFFPPLEGFRFDREMETYTPDTLFEYINGGADLFLNFEFERLHSRRYKNEKGGEITVDIYIHRDHANGFGIYTQERTEDGNFISAGTEGYYEEGILNFFKGTAYVKMSSFDLGDTEEKIMTDLAAEVAAALPGPEGFPALFNRFPGENNVKGSDKFINLNYLGHSFLNRVYSREYKVGGETYRLFAMEGKPDELRKTVSAYTAFIQSRGEAADTAGDILTFVDPYYKKEGKMNLRVAGGILAGMFSNDRELFIKMTDVLVKGGK